MCTLRKQLHSGTKRMDFQELETSSIAAPPFMPWAEFADWCRIPAGVVRGWIDRGYIPTKRVGKHLLVNVEAVRKQLIEESQQ